MFNNEIKWKVKLTSELMKKVVRHKGRSRINKLDENLMNFRFNPFHSSLPHNASSSSFLKASFSLPFSPLTTSVFFNVIFFFNSECISSHIPDLKSNPFLKATKRDSIFTSVSFTSSISCCSLSRPSSKNQFFILLIHFVNILFNIIYFYYLKKKAIYTYNNDKSSKNSVF